MKVTTVPKISRTLGIFRKTSEKKLNEQEIWFEIETSIIP